MKINNHKRNHLLGFSLLCFVVAAIVSGCQRQEPAVASPADVRPVVSEKYVDVKGIKTHYYEGGSGEPLVLVHGGEFATAGGAGALLWNRNLEGLAKNFHVIAFDRLGMGYTDNPKRDEDYSIGAVLQHGYDFFRTLGLDRIHLVGQSRGGYWVTRFTLEHPEMVRTLVICNSATLAPEVGNVEQRRAAMFAGRPKDPREAIKFTWSAHSYTKDHITDEFVDAMLRMSQLPKRQEVNAKMEKLGRTQWLPSLERQKDDTLKRIKAGELKVPTLVAWGYNDRQAILESGIKLFDLFAASNPSTSRMYIVNRADHFHFREYPEEFNRVVTDFIQANR